MVDEAADPNDTVWCQREDAILKGHANDKRDNYERDFSRVTHSASLRRLQAKTQVFNLGDSDIYRTRLTHTLEVAQIGLGIRRQLDKSEKTTENQRAWLPSEALLNAICLTHDLGHPPFGHGGEAALNYFMSGAGGFEGNAQTLRILTKLEKFSERNGANLTRRMLLGVLKYPVTYKSVVDQEHKPKLIGATKVIDFIDIQSSKPPKCYYDDEKEQVEWIAEPFDDVDRAKFFEVGPADPEKNPSHKQPIYKSFDCSIMDAADDISNAVHDIEDGISMGLIDSKTILACLETRSGEDFCNDLGAHYPDLRTNTVRENYTEALFKGGFERKRAVGRLVNYLITNAYIETRGEFNHPLLDYFVTFKSGIKDFIAALKDLNYSSVIKNPRVQQLEFKGQNLVGHVFEAFHGSPKRLLPEEERRIYGDAKNDEAKSRVVCDYIAGMTDVFLLRTYERLFSPRIGSVFDKL